MRWEKITFGESTMSTIDPNVEIFYNHPMTWDFQGFATDYSVLSCYVSEWTGLLKRLLELGSQRLDGSVPDK